MATRNAQIQIHTPYHSMGGGDLERENTELVKHLLVFEEDSFILFIIRRGSYHHYWPRNWAKRSCTSHKTRDTTVPLRVPCTMKYTWNIILG